MISLNELFCYTFKDITFKIVCRDDLVAEAGLLDSKFWRKWIAL